MPFTCDVDEGGEGDEQQRSGSHDGTTKALDSDGRTDGFDAGGHEPESAETKQTEKVELGVLFFNLF